MSNPTASEILANLRRARQAVRGTPATPSPAVVRPKSIEPPRRAAVPEPVAPGGSVPALVPLPDELVPRAGLVEAGPTDQPVLLRPPTVRAIVTAVAAEYGIAPIEIVSDRRGRGVIEPRQLVMYLARHFTTRSLPSIGRILAKDHTTVLWGARAIAARLATLPPIKVDRSTTLAGLVAAHRSALASVLENKQ